MSSSGVVYFSKMFQAVPHLAQVAAELPGIFVSSRRTTLKAANSLYPQLKTARHSRYLGQFSEGNRVLKKADVIVTGSPYGSFLAPYTRAKKCTVFHGTYMMLSRDALLKNSHFDLLCVIGPRMQGMIERFAPEVALNAVATGFLPFCEYPERSESYRNVFMSRLNLDPGNRTIVYTPSRRGIGSWERVAEQLVRTAPLHFNLILRPHPSQSLTSRSRDRASFKRIQTLILQRKNAILDLTSLSLPTVMAVADLVVSDANSPAEESLFYDLPQYFIETPEYSRGYVAKLGQLENMHPEDLERLLGLYDCGVSEFVENHCDFSNSLDKAIDESAGYAEQRQAYFSWVFGVRDRDANRRVAEAIQTHLLV
jgi:CDP-glycerol glycerophosphotransferase (TagB/SpsB family)